LPLRKVTGKKEFCLKWSTGGKKWLLQKWHVLGTAVFRNLIMDPVKGGKKFFDFMLKLARGTLVSG
jgi:hypothetical protein